MILKAQKHDINDINKLGKLVNDNFPNTYLIEDYLSSDKYIILVNKDEYLNAFILIYKNLDCYELEMIVVDENMRKMGIASNLINHFINQYLKKDDIIFLEVSNVNENAINLYKKFGFETVNIRKKYYKDSDAYIMKKVI